MVYCGAVFQDISHNMLLMSIISINKVLETINIFKFINFRLQITFIQDGIIGEKYDLTLSNAHQLMLSLGFGYFTLFY